jgi:hypothetical protein
MRTIDGVRRSGLAVGPSHGIRDVARPVTAEVLFAHRHSPVPAT